MIQAIVVGITGCVFPCQKALHGALLRLVTVMLGLPVLPDHMGTECYRDYSFVGRDHSCTVITLLRSDTKPASPLRSRDRASDLWADSCLAIGRPSL